MQGAKKRDEEQDITKMQTDKIPSLEGTKVWRDEGPEANWRSHSGPFAIFHGKFLRKERMKVMFWLWP